MENTVTHRTVKERERRESLEVIVSDTIMGDQEKPYLRF
jgi:hypothetical protein